MDKHQVEADHGPPVRVAVIGPEDMVQKTLALGARFSSLELSGHAYESFEEAPLIFRVAAPESEVVLFTGPAPYHRVMDEHFQVDARPSTPKSSIPTLYVPYTPAWLHPCLFKIKERNDVTRLSIDTFSRETVLEAYGDLDLPADRLQIANRQHMAEAGRPDEGQRDDLVRFHLDLYRREETSAALTSFRDVHNELASLGVPCFNAVPTQGVIWDTLEKAYLIGNGLRARETQTAVGLIHVDDFETAAGRLGSQYELQRLKLDIQQMLLRYVEEIDGYLNLSGGDEFIFFTTRGLFEKSTRWCTSAPLVVRAKETFGVTISMGVGFGLTANQAGSHARIALERARESGGDACYVLMENQRLLGPLGSDRAIDYDLRTADPELLARAEAAGMTTIALNRLLASAANLARDNFTASELAPILGVTLRSANRLLAQLAEAGHARVVGEEKLTSRGRPRQVYELLIGKRG